MIDSGFTIDQSIITKILDQVQHIEKLYLSGNFSYFNLDSLVNLNMLTLVGTIDNSFNIDIFKNICNELLVLKVSLINIEEKTFFKLFDGHHFPNLLVLRIKGCNFKRLKKEFINRFPIIKQLFINDCNLESIQHNAFSNSNQLYCLDFTQNRLKFIEKKTFSKLKNLEILDLSRNELTNLDFKFIGVKNSAEIILKNKRFETYDSYWSYG